MVKIMRAVAAALLAAAEVLSPTRTVQYVAMPAPARTKPPFGFARALA